MPIHQSRVDTENSSRQGWARDLSMNDVIGRDLLRQRRLPVPPLHFLPQFVETDINFQRVPTVDKPSPLAAALDSNSRVKPI